MCSAQARKRPLATGSSVPWLSVKMEHELRGSCHLFNSIISTLENPSLTTTKSYIGPRYLKISIGNGQLVVINCLSTVCSSFEDGSTTISFYSFSSP